MSTKLRRALCLAILSSLHFASGQGALRGSRLLAKKEKDSWPSCVQDAVDAELRTIFLANPANKKHPLPGPAKMLRLAFHDCVHYEDGTGGCDGCLNWHGMRDTKPSSLSIHFDKDHHFKNKFTGIDSPNFGLEETVMALENLYATAPLKIVTNRKGRCRRNKKHTSTLKQQGYSRADLWAFAALKAAEFSVETTNLACEGNRMRGDDISTTQCLPNEGEPNCRVALPPLVFRSGRTDCTPESDGTPESNLTGQPGYVTFKKEKHPSASMNGQQVVEFMKTEFALNSTETVALMGVHTIGRFHHEVSGMKYVWSSRGEGSLNNQYFRNMALKDDWMFFDNECNRLGGAWGEKPKAKWMAKVNKMFVNNGPVQWIRESHVCPNCAMYDEKKGVWKEYKHSADRNKDPDAKCCQNLQSYADSQGAPKCIPDNGRSRGSFIQGDDDVGGRTHLDGRGGAGCERFKFVGGRDHAALSSDVGLYIDFGVDKDGFPIGCNNNFMKWTEMKAQGRVALENNQNPDVRTDRFINARYGVDALPMSFEGSPVSHQPCGLNNYRASPSEPALFEIVEYFADNQAAWVANFTVALNKMLSNGVIVV